MLRCQHRFEMQKKTWFGGKCGHIYNWREGSRILSLTHGSKTNDVELHRFFPLPAREVIDSKLRYEERGKRQQQQQQHLWHDRRHQEFQQKHRKGAHVDNRSLAMRMAENTRKRKTEVYWRCLSAAGKEEGRQSRDSANMFNILSTCLR